MSEQPSFTSSPVRDAADYRELRQTLIAYADTREEIEVAQHTARGKPRTHYRVLASFEHDVPNEKALGMMKEWLDREFPRSRALAVVHRDTEQTHVHVWIDARQIDGKKIQLARQQHRGLDLSWNHIYSREMGIDPHEHERKKEETRAAKREAWERRKKAELPPRVRKDAQELAPNWQRRELGVQAAREWVERPGGTFLPRFLRAGIYTMPEYLEYRYNPLARAISALFTMVIYVAVTVGFDVPGAEARARSARRTVQSARFMRDHGAAVVRIFRFS